jgi:hypothetical protein
MKSLTKGIKVLGTAIAGGVLSLVMAGPASAGNLFLTGHDLDFHCTYQSAPTQCNELGLALDFVRQAAPDPTLPMLFLDSGSELSTGAGMVNAMANNTVEGAGNAFSFVVMDPSSAAFATADLSAYSAIVVASDSTCGGCDNDAADIAGINARTADIQAFFNAGGGLAYLAGANERTDYYASVPITTGPAGVTYPFTVTADGTAFGITNTDANCCATHNSFALPGAGSPLVVLETDGAGIAETLIARGATIDCTGPDCTLGGGGGTPEVPEPGTLLLLGSGLTGLAAWRKRRKG